LCGSISSCKFFFSDRPEAASLIVESLRSPKINIVNAWSQLMTDSAQPANGRDKLMTPDHPDLGFTFVDEPSREPVCLVPKKRPRSWKSRSPLVSCSVFGLIFVAFLNFEGIIAIPGLESFTRDRVQPRLAANPPVTAPTIPERPRAVAPADFGHVRPIVGQTLRSPAQPDRTPVVRGGAGTAPGRSNRSLQQVRPEAPEPVRAERAERARIDREGATALLEAKDLAQGDTGYVLKSETEARSRLANLQARAAEWNQADVTVRQIQGQLAYLKELDQAVINVNGQIGQLNFAIGQFPATWVRGRWFHGDNNLENDQYNLLVAQKAALVRTRDAELIPERDTLRGQQPGRNLNEAINERRTRQEAAVEALRGLREAVATTQRGYEALPNDPEVKRSLAAVGQAGLVPSPDFLQVVREHQLSESSAAHLKLIDAPGR
jgi:hypothetical protein